MEGGSLQLAASTVSAAIDCLYEIDDCVSKSEPKISETNKHFVLRTKPGGGINSSEQTHFNTELVLYNPRWHAYQSK